MSSAAFLWGAATGLFVGIAASAAACAGLRAREAQTRRITLGHAATTLQQPLAVLEEDGDLTYRLMRQVGLLHELAAAVARVASA